MILRFRPKYRFTLPESLNLSNIKIEIYYDQKRFLFYFILESKEMRILFVFILFFVLDYLFNRRLMSALLYLGLAAVVIIVVYLCCCWCCCRYRKKPARDIEAQRVSGYYSVIPCKTRADAIKALIDERERLKSDENVDLPTADREMRPLIERAVDAILDPNARGSKMDERDDVDLDLHCVRKRDAEALVKLLIRRARSAKLLAVVFVLKCILKDIYRHRCYQYQSILNFTCYQILINCYCSNG